MGMRSKAAALMLAVALSGCAITGIEGEGVVRFIDVEGGCWVIDANGNRFEPINLDAAFQVDGLEVLFSYQTRPDLASICQVGQIVELTDIVAAEQ